MNALMILKSFIPDEGTNDFEVIYTNQILSFSIFQGVSLFGSRGNIDVFLMLFSPR